MNWNLIQRATHECRRLRLNAISNTFENNVDLYFYFICKIAGSSSVVGNSFVSGRGFKLASLIGSINYGQNGRVVVV